MRRLLTYTSLIVLTVLGYLIYLGSTIRFEDRFAHLLIAEGEIIDAQVSTDHQWRIRCDGDLPDKLSTTLKMFEDQYYDYHPGVNPISMIKAVRDNIQAGQTVRGGSTITMQLARIVEGNQPRTYSQKIREILLAFAIELRFSKEEILKAYAQHAPFGGNTVGYCAAALRYYDKPGEDLTWTEAATLSVLPNSPGKIYPGRSQGALVKKRNFLLTKMLDEGLIDSVTYRLSVLEDLPQQSHRFRSLSPHLLQQLKQENPKQFNHQITLDPDLQAHALRVVSQYQLDYGELRDIDNISAIIIRNDGSIAAYIGNVKCENDCGGDVDILRSVRSPGSTLKPFLYGLAIDKGLITPESLLEDIPIFYDGYSPSNFDKQHRGIVSATDALTTSLNIPAVNLLQAYGTHPFLSDLRQMGFTTMEAGADHYGLSLILGGSEVNPIQLATAYHNLSRVAIGRDPINFNLIKDGRSETQHHFPLSQGAAYLTLDMLKGVNRPSSEDGWQYFDSGQEIAWKTGTSFGLRDAWSVGTTPDYTVLVWVGNADGEGKAGLTGIGTAAPILFDLFKLLPTSQINHVPSSAMQPKTVCTQSGYTPTDACGMTTIIHMPKGSKQVPLCPYHESMTLDATGNYQVYQDCAENLISQNVFVLGPMANAYYKKSTGVSYERPPYNPDCTGSKDVVKIISPRRNAEILLPTDLDDQQESLIGKVFTSGAVDSLYWFLDDELIDITNHDHELVLDLAPGSHLLTVVTDRGTETSHRFTIVE